MIFKVIPNGSEWNHKMLFLPIFCRKEELYDSCFSLPSACYELRRNLKKKCSSLLLIVFFVPSLVKCCPWSWLLFICSKVSLSYFIFIYLFCTFISNVMWNSVLTTHLHFNVRNNIALSSLSHRECWCKYNKATGPREACHSRRQCYPHLSIQWYC